MKKVRLGCTALAAAVTLEIVAHSGQANSLELSDTQFTVRLTVEFIYPTGPLRCAVTMSGSFSSRSFAKSEGSTIGAVTRAQASDCRMTLLPASLPWDIIYTSFSGELPDIDGIEVTLSGASFTLPLILSIVCLYRTSPSNPFQLELVVDPVTGQIDALSDAYPNVIYGDDVGFNRYCDLWEASIDASAYGAYSGSGGLAFVDLV